MGQTEVTINAHIPKRRGPAPLFGAYNDRRSLKLCATSLCVLIRTRLNLFHYVSRKKLHGILSFVQLDIRGREQPSRAICRGSAPPVITDRSINLDDVIAFLEGNLVLFARLVVVQRDGDHTMVWFWFWFRLWGRGTRRSYWRRWRWWWWRRRGWRRSLSLQDNTISFCEPMF